MPIEEMVKQSLCCINFLQELLKSTLNSSEEEHVSLTEECRLNFELSTSVKFSGEGCYTLLVCIEETYIGEALCDSGANANLMSIEKAKELRNQKMSPKQLDMVMGMKKWQSKYCITFQST